VKVYRSEAQGRLARSANCGSLRAKGSLGRLAWAAWVQGVEGGELGEARMFSIRVVSSRPRPAFVPKYSGGRTWRAANLPFWKGGARWAHAWLMGSFECRPPRQGRSRILKEHAWRGSSRERCAHLLPTAFLLPLLNTPSAPSSCPSRLSITATGAQELSVPSARHDR
jgi:hypothetical protein